MNPHVLTDSVLRAVLPMNASGQHIARPNAMTTSRAATASAADPPKRNPRIIENPTMITTLHAMRTPSAMVRPPITGERAIGSDRNLSITPREKSVLNASAVVKGRKHTLWIRMPGRANSRYSLLEPAIAPPNT